VEGKFLKEVKEIEKVSNDSYSNFNYFQFKIRYLKTTTTSKLLHNQTNRSERIHKSDKLYKGFLADERKTTMKSIV